ncbi:ICMT-domain-containing protein [Dentipellis sp. KUC8613]|nr:ICMT-domain-containing protein [Dentipellis sp. KUC8613]
MLPVHNFSTLLKIPILVTCAYLYDRATTPPRTEKIEEQERALGSKHISLLERQIVIDAVCTTGKGVIWGCGLAETGVILAFQFPTHPLLLPAVRLLAAPRPLNVPNVGSLTSLFLVGAAFVIAGSLIRLWCFRTMGRLFTYRLTLRDQHRLVTSGPYAIVRHPSYTGAIMKAGGMLLVLFSPGSWWYEIGRYSPVGKAAAAAFVAVCTVGMQYYTRGKTEDQFLRRQFGKEWDAWAERVPYRYIPGVC